MLKTLFVKDKILYDGSQIHSHWAYRNFNIIGDSIVFFLGPCDVKREEMVDLEDFTKGEIIKAKEMLHFICEHFGVDIREIIFLQRILVICAQETLQNLGCKTERKGDDLFVDNRKLSVSIATKTPISGKIHLGINIDPEGAPVPAIGLKELGIEPIGFGEEVMKRYKDEFEDIKLAMCKVRWVP